MSGNARTNTLATLLQRGTIGGPDCRVAQLVTLLPAEVVDGPTGARIRAHVATCVACQRTREMLADDGTVPLPVALSPVSDSLREALRGVRRDREARQLARATGMTIGEATAHFSRPSRPEQSALKLAASRKRTTQEDAPTRKRAGRPKARSKAKPRAKAKAKPKVARRKQAPSKRKR